LEVDEWHDSIGVAPNPDPSKSDDDEFDDSVPTDGNEAINDFRVPTSWDADEMEVGNQWLQREMRKLSCFNPWANTSFLKKAEKTYRQDGDRIQHQVRPVLDVITALELWFSVVNGTKLLVLLSLGLYNLKVMIQGLQTRSKVHINRWLGPYYI
jgi:hypothetical protein